MNINSFYIAEQIMANIQYLKILKQLLLANEIRTISFSELHFLKCIDFPDEFFSRIDYEEDSVLIERICAMAEKAESTDRMIPYIVLWSSFSNEEKKCIRIEQVNTICNLVQKGACINFSFVLGDSYFPKEVKQMTDRHLIRRDIVSLFS